MSENSVFVGTTILVLGLHVAALIGSIVRRRLTPLFLVNLAVAAAILIYGVARLPYVFRGVWDVQVVVLMGAELGVFMAGRAAMRAYRVLCWPSCIAFGAHLCGSVTAVAFVLTFRFDRMI